MVYGKIERDKFEYLPDMAYVYFLSDGYVYTAFNNKVPSGWETVSLTNFEIYTREMYADSLTWGLGKPLIQLANADRYGLVRLSDNYRESYSDRAATTKAVNDVFIMLLDRFEDLKSSTITGGADFEALKYVKDNTVETTFDEEGNITEIIRNMRMPMPVADKNTMFDEYGGIMEMTRIYNPLTGEMRAQYMTSTSFIENGSIMIMNM